MAVKYYVLMQAGRDTDHVFTGSSPRRAALKAATRGFTDIKLRERGTDRLHVFKGGRKKVAAPENRPEWLPAQIWRPIVKKLKLEHLKARRRR
ncbi:MAG TPA: non-histone chromosomal MC1 family protein [Candidatus Nanoarchaeia archaeon]|nr:non-histone chromosomal MC1 family protein [Candidatus Nanoarchaeia archaeon]